MAQTLPNNLNLFISNLSSSDKVVLIELLAASLRDARVNTSSYSPSTLQHLCKELDAMPESVSQKPFSNRKHDEVLYPTGE